LREAGFLFDVLQPLPAQGFFAAFGWRWLGVQKLGTAEGLDLDWEKAVMVMRQVHGGVFLGPQNGLG